MATTDGNARYRAESHVDAEVSQFINDFFVASDTPDRHDEYVNQFLVNGTFILGSRRSVGSDG